MEGIAVRPVRLQLIPSLTSAFALWQGGHDLIQQLARRLSWKARSCRHWHLFEYAHTLSCAECPDVSAH
eukprot:3889189-Amphidinium_carterae.1